MTGRKVVTIKDLLAKLVRNGTVNRSLNTLPTRPGARNPFVTSKKPLEQAQSPSKNTL